MERSVLPETVAVAALGCLDLVASTILLATGHAYEGNPLFREALRQFGPLGFAALKFGMLAGPLAIAEYARHRHLRLVRALLRVCLAAYTAILMLGLGRLALAMLTQGSGSAIS